MALSDVSSILWRERELLELLLFKLEEEQLLLAAGRSRWLASATREVEVVLEQIRRAEFARSVEVAAVTAELGLDEPPSLTRLAEVTSPPWDEIFRDHRAAFLGITSEITALAAVNRDLLAAGYRAAQEALTTFGEQSVETYTSTGTAAGRPRTRLLDGAL